MFHCICSAGLKIYCAKPVLISGSNNTLEIEWNGVMLTHVLGKKWTRMTWMGDGKNIQPFSIAYFSECLSTTLIEGNFKNIPESNFIPAVVGKQRERE